MKRGVCDDIFESLHCICVCVCVCVSLWKYTAATSATATAADSKGANTQTEKVYSDEALSALVTMGVEESRAVTALQMEV